jgi:hypothetical protein
MYTVANSEHVVTVDGYGDVLDFNNDGSWHADDLTAATHALPPGTQGWVSFLTGFSWVEPFGKELCTANELGAFFQAVVYVGPDGHIYELINTYSR